jgi:hypothetical protein
MIILKWVFLNRLYLFDVTWDCVEWPASTLVLFTVELPITVASRSETLHIFTLSDTGMSVFILCLCCPVKVGALRRADPPCKKSYWLSIRFKFQISLILNGHRPENLIHQGGRRWTFWPINREVLADCRLSRSFSIYFDFVVECLYLAEMECCRAASVFSVEVSRVNTWTHTHLTHFDPEGDGSVCLRNIGNTAQFHTVQMLKSRYLDHAACKSRFLINW